MVLKIKKDIFELSIINIMLTLIIMCMFFYSVVKSEKIYFYLGFFLIINVLTIEVSKKNFLFSTNFWFLVVVDFYFLLKSLEMYLYHLNDAYYYRTLLEVIIFSFFFLLGYFFNVKNSLSKREIVIKKERLFLIIIILANVLGMILSEILLRIFGGNTSDLITNVQNTQNAGVTYFFRMLAFFQSGNNLLIVFGIALKKFNKSYKILLALLFLNNIITASRSGIIFLIFTLMYLTYKYKKKYSLLLPILLVPFLIFIVAFFGIVRNGNIGDYEFYLTTFDYMMKNKRFVFSIFMNRMDLLPMMVEAVKKIDEAEISLLFGKSYVYMFLHSIPRSLWSAKPLLTSTKITKIVYPNLYRDGVSVYSSIIVEGYMNLKTVGVIISGVVSGILSRYVNKFHQSKNILSTYIYLALFTFPMGLINEGFHSNYFSGLIITMFLLYIYIYILIKLRIIEIKKLVKVSGLFDKEN